MKHLPDLRTLRHRCPLFHSSVCPSVNSSVMSKFDIYVKVSILINYKTKQPSNLVWNISLTSWLCDIGARFSIRPSVRPSVCLLTVLLCRSSTFTSKLVPASVAQLDAPSDWRPGGRGFNPRRGRQHSFVEIDHEIFSTVILSLPLIQEGQLSVSGERMCTVLVNRLED